MSPEVAADWLGDHAPPDAYARIKRAFRFMSIAEEEIARAAKRWRGGDFRSAFGMLYPRALLAYGEALYRAHCKEMLDRIARRERVEPGTLAECCVALSEATLRAPPNQDLALAYEKAFRACFPKAEIAGEPPREHLPGEADAILAKLREKLAIERAL